MHAAIRTTSLLGVVGVVIVATGCTKHTVTVEPIRVEPIHLTIDVNVRVDRELDDFFDYKSPPSLQPTNGGADSGGATPATSSAAAAGANS